MLLLIIILFMWALPHNKFNKSRVGVFWSTLVSCSCARPTSSSRWARCISNRTYSSIHCMSCLGLHVSFSSIQASLVLRSSSSSVELKYTRTYWDILDANSYKPCTLIHNLPCRTSCRHFIHELFFGPLGLHLLV